MVEKSSTVVKSEGRSMTVTRRFAAPREVVFDLWSDPKHITQWWGPAGFSTTTQSMDFRPGGFWRHVMHGPDGTDYDNIVQYREIVRPERIAYTHVNPPPFEATATFVEIDGQTELTFTLVFPTEAMRQGLGESGAVEGLRHTVDRLNAHLAGGDDLTDVDPVTFVIGRTFDAPRDLVWRAWTDAKCLAAWFGPKGMPISKSSLDFRVGGSYHYAMTLPNAAGDMWGLWRFTGITAPNRIVKIASFSDADGNVTRAPFFDGKWPLETLATVLLTETPDGRTTVTLHSTPINASDTEREAFKSNHASMTGGWGGTFEQLAAFVQR